MKQFNLNKLSEKERIIIELRHGLKDNKPKSLLEISNILGITRERARQLENHAINTLRNTKE